MARSWSDQLRLSSVLARLFVRLDAPGGPLPSKMFAPEAPSPSIFPPECSAACQLGATWEEAQEEGRGLRGQCPPTTQQQAQEGEAQVRGLAEGSGPGLAGAHGADPVEGCARSSGQGKGKGSDVP